MLKKLLLALALVGTSATAFAQFDDDSSTSSRDRGFPRHNCSIYDRNPRACDADQSCFFDYRWNSCVDANGGGGGGGGGGTTYCPRWDRDPRACNAQSWCQFDSWSNRCVDAGGGGGGGGGGGRRETWECSAVDQGWEEHRSGHTAQGRNYNDAQYEALDLCERYHGRCVIQNCRQIR